MTTLGFEATALLGERSGVGHYSKRLLSAIMCVSPEWDFHLYSNRPLGELKSGLHGAQEIQSYMTASNWLWMQLKLPNIIRQDNPDVCHFPNSRAPIRQSRPYVVTIHDASLFLYSQYHPWSRIATMRLFMPLVARNASAIIVPSHVAGRDLTNILSLPPEKVHVIHEAAPNWFRRVEDSNQLESLRRKYKLPEQFILCVGTLEPRKNLIRLIRALANLHQRGRRIPLVLVGPSGWHMSGGRGRISIYDSVRELRLTQHIQYLGYVPTADLPGLMSLATVFAFPSLYEGFGLPALEAMACGTPVLTSSGTAMEEICGDAAYLINPKSVDSIAAGLETLLANSDLRQTLGQQGQLQASRYSWEQAAAETIAVYRKVLAITKT